MEKLSSPGSMLILLIAALALSPGALAAEVDLARPLRLEPGKGVVVFSLTAKSSNISQATLRWRRDSGTSAGGDVVARLSGIGANEEFAAAGAGRTGRLIALSLEEGSYEFFEAVSMSWRPIKSSTLPMSRRFKVTAGQVSYAGNFDLLFRRHLDMDDQGTVFSVFLGVAPLATEVHPAMRDYSASDIPLLLAKQPQLTREQIRVDVTLDAEDEKHSRVQRSMEERAARGERGPRIWLMSAFLNGETGADGRQVRVPRDTLQAIEHARALAGSGEKEANLLLAIFHDPDRGRYEQITVVQRPDAALAFRHYKAAAERYSLSSAKRVMEAYDRGELGQARDERLAAIWRTRYERINSMRADALPISKAGRESFDKFMAARVAPTAFFLSPSGASRRWIPPRGAAYVQSFRDAMQKCTAVAAGFGEQCYLYVHDGTPMWDACRAPWDGRPDTQSFPDPELPAALADRAPDFIKDASARSAYDEFSRKDFPRAFAYSPATGHFGSWSGTCLSATAAIQACEKHAPGSCELVIQDDRIVADSVPHRKLAELLREKLARGELSGPVHATLRTDDRPRPERRAVAPRETSAAVTTEPVENRIAESVRAIAAAPADPRLADVHAVPFISERGRNLYEQFLAAKRRPRAFAISLVSSSNWATGPDAVERAKEGCEKFGSACFIYALDDRVLWDGKITIDAAVCDPSRVDPKLCDVDAVPVRAEGKDRYKAFLTIKQRPRTFVVSEGGGWRFLSGAKATERALEACRKANQGCEVYAEDDKVIWNSKEKRQ